MLRPQLVGYVTVIATRSTKPLELRKVIQRFRDYGIVYVTGKGRHPKFYDPETNKSYPVKSHGKKTLILSYALEDMTKKFDLPADIFD